jgi:transcriptional regulator with XRE-family HTH domain
MIRTEKEYALALRRVQENRQRVEEYRAAWEREGLDAEQINRLLQPILMFHRDLEDDVRTYERARHRVFGFTPLSSIGRLLIKLRIANGLSQRELAQRLHVHESVVSRDERNEYHGVTVERADRIVSALGEEVVVAVKPRPFVAGQYPAIGLQQLWWPATMEWLGSPQLSAGNAVWLTGEWPIWPGYTMDPTYRAHDQTEGSSTTGTISASSPSVVAAAGGSPLIDAWASAPATILTTGQVRMAVSGSGPPAGTTAYTGRTPGEDAVKQGLWYSRAA